jgi:hypothetical protein
MDRDLNRLLFELLGTLSEATRKISEILCREAGGGPGAAEEAAEPVARLGAGLAEAVTALERAQAPEEGSSEDAAAPDEVDPPEAADPVEPPAPAVRRRGRLTVTEEELRRLYIDEDLPARVIAERFGVSAAAINQRLRLWGIGKRAARGTRNVPSPAGGEETAEDGSPPLPAAGTVREGFEPDPEALRDAETAFRDEEAPARKGAPEAGEEPKKKFRLVGRRP